jgi:hypothetical protein
MPATCSNCFDCGRRTATQHRILVTNPQSSMASRTESRIKMSVNNKRVFYVKYLAHEIYADILRARPDVRLDWLENEGPRRFRRRSSPAAHAYQVGAARDELARHFTSIRTCCGARRTC